MQNWAKRGLQTALVTGGLLMLGTGIASADEKDAVNPDKPANPLDASLTIPIDIGNNAIGTPLGQVNLPEVKKTISTKPVTDALKGAAAKLSGQRVQQAGEKAAAVAQGVQQKATAAAPQQAKKATSSHEAGTLEGNRGSVDIVVPVQIANNAIALLGDAEVSGGDHQQTYEGGSGVTTDGSGGVLAGNVVDVDYALPVQIANNALGVGGKATSTGNNATQEIKTGDHTATDGSGGVLAGNVIAPQGATPVQLTNNAAALIGKADSSGNTSEVKAQSGGSLLSDGTDGVLAGNVAGVPVALPVELNNSALAGIGKAQSTDNATSAEAQAGDVRHGSRVMKTYAETHGDNGVASGTLIQPQVASDVNVHGLAGAVGGIAASGLGESKSTTAGNTSSTTAQAGGYSNTSAVGGVLSGTVADAPVAFPVEGYCAAAGVVGKASAQCDNETTAKAGRETFTDGTDSVLGGTTATTPVGGTIEAFGLAGSVIGTADAEATETKEIKAGGYNGSRGDGSVGGGNIVQTPVATPIELFGGAASLVGNSYASAEEEKDVSSGGDGNTEDDNAVLASNVIATPIAQPVQAFGLSAAGVGIADGFATSDTETTAGGKYTGSGEHAVGSGNIVQAASAAPIQVFGASAAAGGITTAAAENFSSTSAGGDNDTSGAGSVASGNVAAVTNALPAQAHGLGASLIGNTTAYSDNVTEAFAGGMTTTDGSGGALSGNVVNGPIGGAAGVFGDAVSVVGFAQGAAGNDVTAISGDFTETNGDGGSVSGNVLSADVVPVAQVFGDAVTVAGFADGWAENSTYPFAGGDIASSGEAGALSGNVFDLPAAAIAQVLGNAVAVGGHAFGTAENEVVGAAGGAVDTDAIDAQLPVGVLAQVYNFSVDVLGEAVGTVTGNTVDVTVGEDELHSLVLDGAELLATELPSVNGLPVKTVAYQRSGAPDVTQELPKIADLPELPELPDAGELPVDVQLPQVDLPAPADLPTVERNAGIKQTGLRGLWAKLTGALSGKQMHIQG
ncbi:MULTISPECIES: hypothetical protein [Thermocrispum]|jgi:hypothetical protein|uniref:Chaplin domain-containing protein n=1 Tax=Thermocrispum agreste TaxID=37925 RepID=A0ABD6FGS0_9PSEU|nr:MULTISPECIES: hypothetical protein [Thermocrispum]